MRMMCLSAGARGQLRSRFSFHFSVSFGIQTQVTRLVLHILLSAEPSLTPSLDCWWCESRRVGCLGGLDWIRSLSCLSLFVTSVGPQALLWGRDRTSKEMIRLVKSCVLYHLLTCIVLRLEPSSLHTGKTLLLSHLPAPYFHYYYYFLEVSGQFCEVGCLSTFRQLAQLESYPTPDWP